MTKTAWLVLGGGAFLLWKSGGLTALTAGLSPTLGTGALTTTNGVPTGFAAAQTPLGYYRDPLTGALRPLSGSGVPSSGIFDTIARAAIPAAISAAAGVVAAAIRSGLVPSAPITAAVSTISGWEGVSSIMTRDGHTIFSDGTVLLRDGTVIAPDGSVIPGATQVVTPTDSTGALGTGGTVKDVASAINDVIPANVPTGWEGASSYVTTDGATVFSDGTVALANGTLITPDGTVTLGAGVSSASRDLVLADARLADPTPIINAHGDTLYANGTTLLSDGGVIAPDGTLLPAVGPSINDLVSGGYGGLSLGEMGAVSNSSELAGTTLDAVASTTTLGNLSLSDLSAALDVAGPWLTLAGLGLALATTQGGSPAQAASIASTTVALGAMAIGLGTAAAGGLGALVALPLILGAIFGSSETPMQQDPVHEGVLKSGDLAFMDWAKTDFTAPGTMSLDEIAAELEIPQAELVAVVNDPAAFNAAIYEKYDVVNPLAISYGAPSLIPVVSGGGGGGEDAVYTNLQQAVATQVNLLTVYEELGIMTPAPQDFNTGG